ncbi:oligopeptide transporter ATP-binding component [Burkholderia cepacia]|uniref:Oligopeptide transporter ATP-binding component n=1 Tax=Burkholderia cepacia TaxID=292 RepID=A0A103Z9C5_BURCE|nr:ABC transporter ATP-binding protein [Burkholderia cepacia]KVK75960.1 oligopeptide transporter ATP-binding component [Burkholderia cepacia]
MMPIVEIDDLSVSFDDLPALHGINLALAPGEAVGLIGESGSGKSVTWLAALGLLPATAKVSGRVRLSGNDILGASAEQLEAIRGGRIAMVFQDPSSALNPVHRVGTQVMEALRLHRAMTDTAARAEARRLFDHVGIPDAATRLDAYPHELSGGQNQRVMIAMALAGRPDILVADEPTTALDVTVQAQILSLLREVQQDTGMALVLISHDLGVVAELCERAYVMYAGRVVEQGAIDALFRAPRHPYTKGLLGAAPSLSGPRARLNAIPGTVPKPGEAGTGCAFAPRCPERSDACDKTVPALRGTSESHQLACHRFIPIKELRIA